MENRHAFAEAVPPLCRTRGCLPPTRLASAREARCSFLPAVCILRVALDRAELAICPFRERNVDAPTMGPVRVGMRNDRRSGDNLSAMFGGKAIFSRGREVWSGGELLVPYLHDNAPMATTSPPSDTNLLWAPNMTPRPRRSLPNRRSSHLWHGAMGAARACRGRLSRATRPGSEPTNELLQGPRQLRQRSHSAFLTRAENRCGEKPQTRLFENQPSACCGCSRWHLLKKNTSSQRRVVRDSLVQCVFIRHLARQLRWNCTTSNPCNRRAQEWT